MCKVNHLSKLDLKVVFVISFWGSLGHDFTKSQHFSFHTLQSLDHHQNRVWEVQHIDTTNASQTITFKLELRFSDPLSSL